MCYTQSYYFFEERLIRPEPSAVPNILLLNSLSIFALDFLLHFTAGSMTLLIITLKLRMSLQNI